MQPISSFNSNLGTAIALVGPAGTGKTVLGMRLFPRTAVIVLDLNFTSGLRYCESIKAIDNILGFETITVDETGKAVPPYLWYDCFFKKLNELAADPSVDAIFVDGATQITDCIIAKIVNAQRPTDIQIAGGKDSWPKWGTVGVTWKGLITQIRSTGKKFIMAVHEQKNKDESDQIWKHELLIPGQTKDTLPNLMSDVWRTEVKENMGKHEWLVRTLPNVRMEFLKNTYGLPGILSANDLVKQIQTLTPIKTPTPVAA